MHRLPCGRGSAAVRVGVRDHVLGLTEEKHQAGPVRLSVAATRRAAETPAETLVEVEAEVEVGGCQAARQARVDRQHTCLSALATERCSPTSIHPSTHPQHQHKLLIRSVRETHGMKDVVAFKRDHIIIRMEVIFTDGTLGVSEGGCWSASIYLSTPRRK